MSTTARHGLQLFGDVRWHAGGSGLAFKAERRFQLLALLACQREGATRAHLAEQLWPDRPPADALRNLRKVIMQASCLAATLPSAPPLELHGNRLRWPAPSDLADFLLHCDASQHALAAQTYQPGLLQSLETGLGDAALGWLARQRAGLEQRWHHAVQHWLDALARQPAALADAAEAVLARDPLHEATLRVLLQACATLEQPARAQRALQRHAQLLQHELGITPSADLAQATTLRGPQVPAPRRPIASAAVQGIIEAAMDAVADERQWPALLQQLTRAMHGMGAMVAGCSFTRPQDGLMITHGLDPALSQRFLERYQDNPWSRASAAVPPGQAFDQAELVPRRLIEGTAFYQDIVRPQQIINLATLGMPMGYPHASGGINVCFGGSRSRRHSEQARRLLEQVGPYLQRATATLLRWHGVPRGAALRDSLQLLPCAALVLAADARLLFANTHADALLSRGDALYVRQGRLVAAHPAEAPQLDALLHEAAQALATPLVRLSADLRLSGVAAGRLRVSVAPLLAGSASQPLPAGAAALLLANLLP